MLEDHGVRSVPQIEVETRLDEAQLNELDCVDHLELVNERENSYLYVIEVKALEMPEGR